MRALQLEVCCLICVFIQCEYARMHGYSHAYLSVCECLCSQFFSYFDVLFMWLILGLAISEPEELKRLCHFYPFPAPCVG